MQTALLQVEKAEAELATARSRRLPVFETEVSASQLVTAVDFAFPQGAFGTFPGTGPIPAADTTVSVPRQPTAYVSSQISQPLTQLVQIGLGVKSAAASRDIEQERVRGAASGGGQQRQAPLLRHPADRERAEPPTRRRSRSTASSTARSSVRVAQKVALRSDALDVQLRLAQAELARTTYTNTLASQKEQLNQLLGRDVQTDVRGRRRGRALAARGRPDRVAHDRAGQPSRRARGAAEAGAGGVRPADRQGRPAARDQPGDVLHLELQHRHAAGQHGAPSACR